MQVEVEKSPDRILADAVPDGIVVLDAAGYIYWWNAVIEKVLGFSAQTHQSKLLSDFIDDPLFHRLLRDKSIRVVEIQVKGLWLQIQKRAYWGEQQILIFRDTTQLHRLESVRQNFVANISHELRTPLTVFRGYLELFRDHERADPEKFKQILDQMLHQSARMERMVEDLLLLSHLENHEPDPERHAYVSVASLLQSICDDAKQLSGVKTHDIRCEADASLVLMGSSDELQSAFSNLVFNAVRYTPAKGKITVRWYRDATGKHLDVQDSGIGIPEQDISRITQRFYRVDKSRSKQDGYGGSGLGLSIVKHVLLRHKGHLSISSEAGKGSCFRCTFPL